MFFIRNKIFILFISLFIFILGVFLYNKIAYWFNARSLKKRFARSKRAEREAEKFLKKKGFAIVDSQKSKPILITIGDKIHRYLIRIDYLVRKKGKIYVVEVKSGEKSPYITNRETRRQMLEYYLAYQPNGIILLNMKSKSIAEVKFQFEKKSHQWIIKLFWFVAGIIFSILIYYLFFGG